MTMNNDLFEQLCTAYVLNALSEQEEQEFIEMLAEANAEQRLLFEDMKALAAEMAVLSPLEQPSTRLKVKLLKAIKSEPTGAGPSSTIYQMPRFRYAVAASVVFLLFSIGLIFYSQSLKTDIDQQTQIINQQQNRITQLQSEIERREELLNILEARQVDLVLMDGLEVNPNGYGKVVWDKDNGRALLQVSNLPAVPLNKDYQLWFVVNNQPISAGVFAVNDPQQDNFFKIEELQTPAVSGAFAITLEPEGGSPQPTGDMYLLGNTQ